MATFASGTAARFGSGAAIDHESKTRVEVDPALLRARVDPLHFPHAYDVFRAARAMCNNLGKFVSYDVMDRDSTRYELVLSFEGSIMVTMRTMMEIHRVDAWRVDDMGHVYNPETRQTDLWIPIWKVGAPRPMRMHTIQLFERMVSGDADMARRQAFIEAGSAEQARDARAKPVQRPMLVDDAHSAAERAELSDMYASARRDAPYGPPSVGAGAPRSAYAMAAGQGGAGMHAARVDRARIMGGGAAPQRKRLHDDVSDSEF